MISLYRSPFLLQELPAQEILCDFEFMQRFCSHSASPCPHTRILPLLAAHHCPPLEKMAWINHVFSKKTLAVQPLPHHLQAHPHSSPKRCHWYDQDKTISAVYYAWVTTCYEVCIYCESPPPEQRDKAGTPGLKSSTPTPRGDSTPGPSSTPGIRPSMSKPPSMEIPHPPSEQDFWMILNFLCRCTWRFTLSLVYYIAAGLRTPLAVPGPYPGAFGMLPHPAGINGELAGAAGAAAYAAGLHNMSPQMSAAAAAAVAAYGRSPMVSMKD